MFEPSQEDLETRMEAILLSAYNCAFVGLRNTEYLTIPLCYFEVITGTLDGLAIRNVTLIDEENETFRLCCFTTGIKTDKPFDKDQI